MRLTFEPMSAERAREIMGWRYDEPYALYDLDSHDAKEVFRKLTNPLNRYFSITDIQGQLVAYRCFGKEARVAGGEYTDDALDTGGGLRPDLTGQGLGLPILRAGLSFGQEQYQPKAFRVTVATFNVRALRVCERAGFYEVRRFKRPTDGLEFVILVQIVGV